MRDLRILFNDIVDYYNDEDLGVKIIKHYPPGQGICAGVQRMMWVWQRTIGINVTTLLISTSQRNGLS